VKPELLAQVSFSTWTADNLRQTSCKGLREDKPASKVVREMPRNASSAAATAGLNHKQAARKSTLKRAESQILPAKIPVRLTHPDKIIDAESGVTKEQLALYYKEVAPHMLPYVADRPLTLVRCVDGSGNPCFYQRHTNKMFAGGFKTVAVRNKKTGVDDPYITLDSEDAIVQLAQVGVLEVHPWGSRNQTLEQPDRIVIDLDPDPAIEWHSLTESAKEVRKRLNALGLNSWVKTTGGKGLHVVFPVRPEHAWPAVKQWTREFVDAMARDFPMRFLTKMSKAARVGKIFLDYLRNDRNATSVAPFSPRARASLPVAIPLSWTELDSDQPPRFQVVSFADWKMRLTRNPWKDMEGTNQRLPL
jgi:bifunctional non-homologous end joining protein LigD